jgi:hypothetical protein
MKIRKFKESEIRKAILNKAKPTISSKRSKHDKGLIYLGDIIVARVKIPNNHIRIMQPSKSKYIAESLRLDETEFNEFVDCHLKGKEYITILKNQGLS